LIETQGIIISNKRAAESIHRIEVETERMELSKPGQFAMIGIQGDDFHLNRPFSIYRQKENKLTFLVQKRGTITLRLIKKSAGAKLRIIGPLGNWFQDAPAVIVAAGSSIAAFGSFIGRKDSTIFYGAATRDDLINIDADFFSTMDGSRGFRGNLVELFMTKRKQIDKRNLYIAGPSSFIKAFGNRIDDDLANKCCASLEAYMGCGFGVCLGCVINTKNGYKRVCKDGTIFPLKELLL